MKKNSIRLLKNIFSLIPYSFTIFYYFIRYYFKKTRFYFEKEKKGFSILLVTYNRAAFLKRAIESITSTIKSPYELIIFDNASSDETRRIVTDAIRKQDKPIIKYYHSNFNYGTNAYALAFLHSKYNFIVVMDDDILALQEEWDEKVKQCFNDFNNLGFLALDVIQDRFTNGAKHEEDKYAFVNRGKTTLQTEGPAGGWFGVTLRKTYFHSGGFIFRPDKPFRLHDADYVGKIKRKGYISGILYKVYAYHASGQLWAVAGGYQKIWKKKYKKDFKEFVHLTDNVKATDIPDFSVPQKAIETARKL